MSPDSPLILYVDDERPNRIVFEQSFGAKFRVRAVADGNEALAVLRAEEVAVILTDQRMPQMSGDELLRVVKREYPATIRVVITAYSDIEPILTAINEGLVARYIVKPWDRAELDQLLRWAVEAHAFGKDSAALQLRLLETERLATLGSIAGAMLHDLNQPLIGLVMNVDRLTELAGAVPALERAIAHATATLSPVDRTSLNELLTELPDLAADLTASCEVMRGMTSDLSQFLRAAPRTTEVTADPLPVVRHALAVCQEIAMKARGMLSYDGPATLPRVRISATELTQVMINLVANGAQALSARGTPGGRVVVTAREVPDAVRFEIRDEGVGMPPEVLAKVGTPFFTTRTQGTGLGVAQCQRLVGRAGGTFRIDSTVGVGTTVTITLPAPPAPPSP
jgi:signal transduction histidine kinase